MEMLNEFFAWATGFIDSLTQLVTDSPITYLVIFTLTVVDVLLPVIPAEAAVTAAAVLAGQGSLNVVWLMLAAGLGAFVGDNVAYWIGRAAGRPVVTRILRGQSDQLDRAQVQFDQRGGIFIIIGRFIPGGRTVVAISAGVLHFSWLQFLAYDALAAVIWSFQAVIPGFIGGSIISDKPWLAMIFGFVLSGSLALTLALTQRWWQSRQQAKDGGPKAAEMTGDVGAGPGLRRRVVSRVIGVPEALPGEDIVRSASVDDAERADAAAGVDGDGLEPAGPDAEA